MTYCLSCKDYTDSIGPKKGTMTNKVIREKSRYTECVSDKARLKKKKLEGKTSRNNINLKLSIH